MKEKYTPGEGCECSARCGCECGCDVDWTPREVYELREQRDRLAEAARTLPDYDAGLLNDFGGGDAGWWQDYIRAEVGRANEYWREALAAVKG
jgi:hypothetical protein